MPKTKMITALGETKLMKEWANDSRCSISYTTLGYRIRAGWEIETAILTPVRPPAPSQDEKCLVEGCDQRIKASTQSLCNAHYLRLNRRGSLTRKTMINAGTICGDDNCVSPATSKGYCQIHFSRWKRWGDSQIVYPRFTKLCVVCSEPFLTNPEGPHKIYCFGRCAAESDTGRLARSRRRRDNLREAFMQDIDRELIFDIYNGTCYLCGIDLDPNDWHLDHIHPISKGGKHSYHNVAPSCGPCNLAKWAKTLVELSWTIL